MSKQPKTNASRGRRNREKGQEHERELVASLRQYWPDAIRGIQCRGEVDGFADIERTPLRWECKTRQRHEAIKLLIAADQEADQAQDTRPVVLALRQQGSRRVACVVWLDEMPQVLDQLQAAREAKTPVTEADLPGQLVLEEF